MPYQVRVTRQFSAAHRLPKHPGPCQHLHGHNFRYTVVLEAETLDFRNMVVDFGRVKEVLRSEIESAFDHRYLNEIFAEGDDPTAECIAHCIFTNVKDTGLPVVQVEVEETPGNVAVYYERQPDLYRNIKLR